jgi:hypothetical protein
MKRPNYICVKKKENMLIIMKKTNEDQNLARYFINTHISNDLVILTRFSFDQSSPLS